MPNFVDFITGNGTRKDIVSVVAVSMILCHLKHYQRSMAFAAFHEYYILELFYEAQHVSSNILQFIMKQHTIIL